MIPKSGRRFSEKIMLHPQRMFLTSGALFSENIMLHEKSPRVWTASA